MRINESKASIIEAGANPNETHILILEEGPGNPKNKCWYGREAVTDAKDAFRGVRMFANHLGRKDAENRPERDVEAVVGRVKETYLRTNEETGKLQCWGIAKVVEGDSCKWIKERINESVRAVQEGFAPIMQTSINGDGDATPREINGERWNYVQKINMGISVDYVPMGGIKNAGFRDIMESSNLYSGGAMNKKLLRNLSAEDRERYERINGVIESALTAEDLDFMDATYAKLSEGDNGDGDDLQDGGDFDGDEGNPDGGEGEDVPAYLLTLEDGSQVEVGEPDEILADGSAVWYDEEGTPVVLSADAFEDDYEQLPADAENDPEYLAADDGDDEIDFEDLKARYPILAAELERGEMGARAQEANLDPEQLIGNLQEARLQERTERVLLESRILAERKLAEAGVPEVLLAPDKLVGLTPAGMDREIERAMDHADYVHSVVRESLALHGDGGFSRGSQGGKTAVGTGKRILAGACKKY